MIGKVDTNSREYQALFAFDDPLTGGEVWLNKAVCADCVSLHESVDGVFLPIETCPNCGSRDLYRPPAYGPITLERWWKKKLQNRSQERAIFPNRPLELLPLAKEKRQLESKRKAAAMPKLDPGPDANLDDIIEKAKDSAQFRKRKGIEKPTKFEKAIRKAREGEGPNVEKNYTIIVPPFFGKNNGHQ